jgi:hypothetical protein
MSARARTEDAIMEKLAFTIPEAVEAGAGSRTVVYEAINAGTLKAKKRGKRTVILAADLAQYLESLPAFPGQEAA